MNQEALFEPKDPPPKKRVVRNGNASPVWSRYYSAKAKKPHKCDYCLANMADDPLAPAARLARFRRRTKDSDLYLCAPHANNQRQVDGLSVFKVRANEPRW